MIALGYWALLTSTVYAESLFAELSGTFTPTTSYETIVSERDASVARSLEASNFIVRTIAASTLSTQPRMCAQYQFEHKENVLFVQCDDHPNISVYLDGRPTRYPKKDGTSIDVIAKVQDDTITQVFPFPNGTLTVIYKYEQDQFWVQKSIESPYLGLPVVAEGTYRAKISTTQSKPVK
jgi:hypothetical protein